MNLSSFRHAISFHFRSTIEYCNDEIDDPMLKAVRVPTKLTFSEVVKVKNFRVDAPSPCFLGEYETETEMTLMTRHR